MSEQSRMSKWHRKCDVHDVLWLCIVSYLQKTHVKGQGIIVREAQSLIQCSIKTEIFWSVDQFSVYTNEPQLCNDIQFYW